MGVARIPVDLFNPGQVFACLGFLEATDVLVGGAVGGFDWHDEAAVRFVLRTPGDDNPVEVVLRFLAEAKLSRWAPTTYRDPPAKSKKSQDKLNSDEDEEQAAFSRVALVTADHFPARAGDRMTLPVRLQRGSNSVDIGHWSDESSRESFKLYAGNRSAAGIAADMLQGHEDKKGRVLQRGISQLWGERCADLIAEPFDVLTPMGGSFNFDPRGSWTAIDAGYSLNDQKHDVSASPVVQVLAAWGLEHARPPEHATRRLRYAAWGLELRPMLARAALAGAIPAFPYRRFQFTLALSGKNKVVTFANQESSHD